MHEPYDSHGVAGNLFTEDFDYRDEYNECLDGELVI